MQNEGGSQWAKKELMCVHGIQVQLHVLFEIACLDGDEG